MTQRKLLTGGVEPHELTTEERRKGAETTNARRRALMEDARALMVEQLAAQMHKAIRVVDEAMDAETGYVTKDGESYMHEDHPTRLRAADKVFDRIAGRPSQPIVGAEDGPVQIEVTDARERLASGIAGIAARTGEAEASS